jgi:hypothetical protein
MLKRERGEMETFSRGSGRRPASPFIHFIISSDSYTWFVNSTPLCYDDDDVSGIKLVCWQVYSEWLHGIDRE